MSEIPEDLFQKIEDISTELEAIKHTFVSTTEKQRDSFKPFLVLFTDPKTKAFVATSRPVVDAQDYFTALSEMMFAYSAVEATALLFAIDANKIINDQQQDLLEIYMACDDYCTVFTLPYYFTEDNKFKWNDQESNVYTLEKLEKAYDTNGHFHATLEIFEVLYMHTHMDAQYFDIVKIKSFFNATGFNYAHLSENKSDSIPLKI
jgi:hypothetical protein